MRINKTNLFILIGIFSFLLSNQIILYFEILPDINKGSITIESGKDGAFIIQKSNISKLEHSRNKTDNQYLTSKPESKELIVPKAFFNQNPNLLLYIFFLSFLMSISLSLLYPLIIKIKILQNKMSWKEKVFYILVSVIISLVLFFLSNIIPNAWSPQSVIKDVGIFFKHPIHLMMILLVPALVLTSICIYGLFCLSIAIRQIEVYDMNKEKVLIQISDFKKILDHIILILGVIITSGSIIISSTLVHAINDFFSEQQISQIIPKEFVYLYGLSYSLGLVFMYVPIYLAIQKKSKEILSIVNPINLENYSQWKGQNDFYIELIGIKMNVYVSLMNILKIGAPLITSILATLITV